MEQQVEGRDHGTIPTSPNSNTIIQSSIKDTPLSSPTSSGSSAIMQLDGDDENMPLLASGWLNTTLGSQQYEERELSPRANFYSAPFEDESSPPFSGPLYPGIEEQHEHSPFLPSTSGELSVAEKCLSNIFAQQAEIHHLRPFSLSDPMQSSTMLRRNTQAESASTGRSSTSNKGLQNLDPQRVRQLISTLGFDDQRSEFFFKLILATAPFYKAEPYTAPPSSEDHNSELRETLGKLIFAPTTPTGTIAEEALADNSTKNLTADLLFGANAAGTIGPDALERRSDSPPLLWSTAMVEGQLDPNAEEPTVFTVAEFINTIIEKNIQVESVNEDDWWIEELRVAILNRLMNDTEENLTAEGIPNEVAATTKEATEQVKAKENTSHTNYKAEGDSTKVAVAIDEATEEVEAKEDASSSIVPVEGDSNKSGVAKGKAPEQAKAREDTSQSDLQRWKEQGPNGWLKRADGTDMNEEEIDEECARFDDMVMKARTKRAIEKVAAAIGPNFDLQDKAFWEFVRSSKQKEQSKGSGPAQDLDGEASEKKLKKGSRKNKNKNKNRKAKKNALKGGGEENVAEEVSGEVSGEVPETETIP